MNGDKELEEVFIVLTFKLYHKQDMEV